MPSKIIQIILLCVILLRIINAEDFDPTKFNYCSVKCNDPKDEHIACKCNKLEGKRRLFLDDMENFRTAMVDRHNVFRNRLASGVEEAKYNFPKAANMHVVNYDLELEYIAYCHAKTVMDGHDKCRKKHNFPNEGGQNIYGVSSKLVPQIYGRVYNRSVEHWYEEIKYVATTSIIDYFFNNNSAKLPVNGSQIGHFTQLIWASAKLIGCAKVYLDEENKLRRAWRTIIICDYQGLKEEGNSGNTNARPIYKKGEPCTQCPGEEKCNTEYGGRWNALCGESMPIPTQKAFEKLNGGTVVNNNITNNNITNNNITNNTHNNSTDKGKTHRIRGNTFFVLGMIMTFVGVYFC